MAKKTPLSPPLPFKTGKIPGSDSASPISLYTDGASRGNPGLAGIGVVIYPDATTKIEGKRFIGKTTNNTAEYEALIYGLNLLLERNLIRPLKIHSDSQLMVRQLNGAYKIKQAHLRSLAGKAHELLQNFPSHEIIHIPRGQNREADRLANEAIDERNKKQENVEWSR